MWITWSNHIHLYRFSQLSCGRYVYIRLSIGRRKIKEDICEYARHAFYKFIWHIFYFLDNLSLMIFFSIHEEAISILVPQDTCKKCLLCLMNNTLIESEKKSLTYIISIRWCGVLSLCSCCKLYMHRNWKRHQEIL